MTEQKLDNSKDFWVRVAVATAFVAMMVGSLNEYLEAMHDPAAQHPVFATQKGKETTGESASPAQQRFTIPDQERVLNEVHKTDIPFLNPSKPAVHKHHLHQDLPATRKTLAQKTV